MYPDDDRCIYCDEAEAYASDLEDALDRSLVSLTGLGTFDDWLRPGRTRSDRTPVSIALDRVVLEAAA